MLSEIKVIEEWEYNKIARFYCNIPCTTFFSRKLGIIDNNIRICFLTASEAYYQQYRDKDFYELSRDLFIQKPIELEELLKRIDDMME